MSPTTRRSRERSLERMAHRLCKAGEDIDRKKKLPQADNCSVTRSEREDNPDDNTPAYITGKKTTDLSQNQLDTLVGRIDTKAMKPSRELSRDPMLEESKTISLQLHMLGIPAQDTGVVIKLRSPDMSLKRAQLSTNRAGPDPMMEEAEQSENANKNLIDLDPMKTAEHAEEVEHGPNNECLGETLEPINSTMQQEHESGNGELLTPLTPTNEIANKAQIGISANNTERGKEDTQQFIKKITTVVPNPMFPTPARKTKKVTESLEEERTVRRSGRIATKQKQVGKKHSEELAQEVLARKLGVLSPKKEPTEEAKTKLAQLFQGPLTKEIMQAMEELLQAMNIDAKKAVITASKSAAKKIK